MIRVAFDIAQTAVQRAGCAWYADGLARALARRSDVQLDTYAHFGPWANATTTGISHIPGATLRLADLDEDGARRFWSEAATAGLPERPAIAHANSYGAPAIAGTKLVFTIHDLSFWSHPAFAQESTRLVCQAGVLDALERAAGLIFVSEAAREEFESILPRWLARTGRPTAIIGGASRFEAVAARTDPGPQAPWLCVGSIEPRKNHDTLLDAYTLYRRAVPDPRPLYLVGGDGWHSEATRARIRALAGAGVRHIGYVDDDTLASHYRAACALIMPSWHEGFGLPVVEAFGFGLPVICADIPSLREVTGGAARCTPPGDAGALATIMIELHRDASARDALAAAGRAASARHSWDASAARAVAFYQSLAD